MKTEEIKHLVREKYSEIAVQDKTTNETTCCGMGATGGTYTIMADSYATLPGYNPDADLGLGCGLPTEFAHIQPGDTVLDLGSGAGNDCFVARAETGDTGKVIGVDFTPAMIAKARLNAEKLGFNNVEFRQGDIEELPVSDQSVDVVVSNCVLNLVPDKAGVFSEIGRFARQPAQRRRNVRRLRIRGHTNGRIPRTCPSGRLRQRDRSKTETHPHPRQYPARIPHGGATENLHRLRHGHIQHHRLRRKTG